MQKPHFRSHFDDLIRKDKVNQAMQDLTTTLIYLNKSNDLGDKTSGILQDFIDELILHQSSLNSNDRGHRLSTISDEEFRITKSKYTGRFQQLLNEFLNNNNIVELIKQEDVDAFLDEAKKKLDKKNKRKSKKRKQIVYYLLIFISIAIFLMIFYFNSYKTVDYVLVSANGSGTNETPWVNSSIHVKKHDQIIIESSGLINTAVHRLIEAAEDDVLPRTPWHGFQGYDGNGAISRDNSREVFKLHRRNKEAQLLISISKKDPHLDFRFKGEEWKYNEKNIISSTNDEKVININAIESGDLWFTINDDWIPVEIFIGSAGAPNSKEKNAKLLYPDDSLYIKKFEYINEKQYRNLWFDDNIGALLLKITVHRKVLFFLP
ncbi:MAG: hypothetical protein SFV55_03680 [Haliscomenobacter sp.]|uniref:hypothetical protein n=1 Tax=Haliscomenobacter sp. TaxID=2717303 RepID=UPI0029B7F0B0|nr:hypothetical protein [Haliscomenobacter sp.]MDX2067500.1 hypothetical protein [Haliscomenobacter sp.]